MARRFRTSVVYIHDRDVFVTGARSNSMHVIHTHIVERENRDAYWVEGYIKYPGRKSREKVVKREVSQVRSYIAEAIASWAQTS